MSSRNRGIFSLRRSLAAHPDIQFPEKLVLREPDLPVHCQEQEGSRQGGLLKKEKDGKRLAESLECIYPGTPSTYPQGRSMESEVLKELRLIRADLKYIRKNMVDRDMILSSDEKILLDESRRKLREGKNRSLDDILRSRRAA
jgi:hypothetical protein